MSLFSRNLPKRGVYSTEQISAIVSPIAARYGTGRMFLFGSYGRGTADKNSDIDILVEPGSIKGYLVFTQLNMDLEETLGKRVDLVSAGCDKRSWTAYLKIWCASMSIHHDCLSESENLRTIIDACDRIPVPGPGNSEDEGSVIGAREKGIRLPEPGKSIRRSLVFDAFDFLTGILYDDRHGVPCRRALLSFHFVSFHFK